MADVSTPDSGAKPARATGILGRAQKKRPGIRIDMTPMVDVAFLLLIFFMVTTVFRRPLAMEVNLPEPDAKVEVPESNVVTVFVDREEDLFVKVGKGGIEPITWADLTPTLQANAAANPNLIVLVKIHREARYEPMVDLMDTLEDAKMERFSLIAMNERDQEALEAAP
ncbi:MAG TPA: biopolymer transporter ExbD [Candidatus Krumholzibacteria bacterium]|nr:biopolymer transporter ExbD [Candidatus Krumholzibacteria bacterium]HPD70556.1 biopolymer transporter ExbD [Candidatus Krumholzibacteria bacterium]HRY39744.1 biopolymer transporter ExbD [Candidatus Krumholzibacteria bacterium]